MGEACVRVDASLKSLAERAEDLTQFAWVFRYPGDVEEPPLEEAEGVLALTRELHAAVIGRLPKEVQ